MPIGPMGDDHELPFIDAPSIEVTASPERCWAALTSAVGGPMGGATARVVAALLRCDDRGPWGPRETQGSTLAGFHIVRSEPPGYWHLRGAHHFAEYSLAFRIHDVGEGRSRVEAESRACFPGWQGTLYRTLVVGSGGHRLAVDRMLGSVKARAEAAMAPPASRSERPRAAPTPPPRDRFPD